MIVTYKQRDKIFNDVRKQVDEEAKGVQNLVVDSEKQLAIRTRYIQGMQQALIFLNKTLDK